MRQIGNFEFPDLPTDGTTRIECDKWKHSVRLYPLHQYVLVVAHTRIEGKWCAYCKNVPGINHRDEFEWVLLHGDKLGKELAEFMFPIFEGIPYAN